MVRPMAQRSTLNVVGKDLTFRFLRQLVAMADVNGVCSVAEQHPLGWWLNHASNQQQAEHQR